MFSGSDAARVVGATAHRTGGDEIGKADEAVPWPEEHVEIRVAAREAWRARLRQDSGPR